MESNLAIHLAPSDYQFYCDLADLHLDLFKHLGNSIGFKSDFILLASGEGISDPYYLDHDLIAISSFLVDLIIHILKAFNIN